VNGIAGLVHLFFVIFEPLISTCTWGILSSETNTGLS
jgi:hypothetical protein